MTALAFVLGVGCGIVGTVLLWLHWIADPERAGDFLLGLYEKARPSIRRRLHNWLEQEAGDVKIHQSADPCTDPQCPLCREPEIAGDVPKR